MLTRKVAFSGVIDSPSSQVSSTWIDQAINLGYELPEGLDKEKLVQLLNGEENLVQDHKELGDLGKFAKITRKLQKLRIAFAEYIERVVEQPEDFGVQNYMWRACQQKTLSDLAIVFRSGYSRPDFELPTGGGKSHILGAVGRSFLEAASQQKFNIDKQLRIILLTSRTNLVHQLAASEESDAEAEMAEDEGSILQLGDFRQWIANLLDDDQIQILTAESGLNELKKQAVLSVQTYQGLTKKRLTHLMADGRLTLFILDESHNCTERVRRLLLQHAPGAFILGGSATPFGPERTPFTLFEEVENGPAQHRKHPWEKKLASHQSVIELIGRNELKQPRLIRADTEISLAGIRSQAGTLNEKDVGKILSRNLPLLKNLLYRLYTKDHPVLAASNQPQLRDRIAIAFVNSVNIAKELAKFMIEKLQVPSAVLSGEDSLETFNKKQKAMQSRDIRFAATVRKGTEGLDVQSANAAILLQPHGYRSGWLRRQELGRVLRIDGQNPKADALLIDAVYKDHPDLTSTLALFGEHEFIDGGLIAPGKFREIERIIIDLLQGGMELEGAINTLEEPDRSIARELFNIESKDCNGERRSVPKVAKYKLKKIRLLEDTGAIEILKLQDRELLIQKAKEALAENDIDSYESLIDMGPVKFLSTYFNGFGKGRAFFSRVVRHVPFREFLGMTHLKEVANALGFQEKSREVLCQEIKCALAEQGVNSFETLMKMGQKRFKQTSFGSFGKGIQLYVYLVGGSSGKRNIGLEELRQISVILDLPKETHEEKIISIKNLLAAKGITSHKDLMQMGIVDFKNASFEPFGKGGALLSVLVERSSKESWKTEHLERMATILGWEKADPETLLERAREVLSINGINSYQDLIQLGIKEFIPMDFQEFGKGTAFASAILGRSVGQGGRSLDVLKECALVLGFENSQEELLNRAKKALLEHQITSRETLRKLGSSRFKSTYFEGFGKGKLFFRKVVRPASPDERMSPNHLEELADTLGW